MTTKLSTMAGLIAWLAAFWMFPRATMIVIGVLAFGCMVLAVHARSHRACQAVWWRDEQ